jgi:hypothetical protein
MINNNKMSLELPEDWKKIIRALRSRPMNLYELKNETGLTYENLNESISLRCKDDKGRK